MKKLTILFSILCAISPTAFSQSSNALTKPFISKGAPNEKPSYVNELNVKAVRDFSNAHPNAASVRWHQVSDGFIVYYSMNDIRSKSAYSPKGDWNYTVRWLNEFQMPSRIRHLVKSTYYDHAIRLVLEISNKKQKYYEVQMEDRSSFTTLTVADGEMEVKEELRKLE